MGAGEVGSAPGLDTRKARISRVSKGMRAFMCGSDYGTRTLLCAALYRIPRIISGAVNHLRPLLTPFGYVHLWAKGGHEHASV